MEYAPYRSLEDYLKAPNPTTIDPVPVWRIAKQVLEGLAFMHKNHFMHCDLKPGVRILSTLISPLQLRDCLAYH